MEARISHVEIGVRDLVTSVAFYSGLLGLGVAPPTASGSSAGAAWIDAGPAQLRLVEVGPDADLGVWEHDDLQRGVRHIGFKVGDVPGQAGRLRDAGVHFTLEPTDAVGDVRIAFFTDPDGTLLELIDRHLHYHEVESPELAERERLAAEHRATDAGPSFDHVAVTVADIDAAVRSYEEAAAAEVIGRLRHTEDPRGFLITYLQVGGSALELFSYAADTLPDPGPPGPERLGFRAVGLAVADPGAAADRLRAAGAQRLDGCLLDANGVPWELAGARAV